MKKSVLFLAVAFILFAVVSPLFMNQQITSKADAGFFSGDNDFGGGDDWGGSSWDDDDDYDDNHYNGGGTYVYSNGSGGGGGGIGTIIAVVVIILIIVAATRRGSSSGNRAPVNTGVTATTNGNRDLSALKAKDPEFSEDKLKEKVANLYVQMQNHWQNKDFEPMRAHMTDTVYNQFARQLEELKRRNQTNYVERISVLGSEIVDYSSDDKYDSLIFKVSTRIIDYTVDDSTGEVVSGDKNREKFLVYEWTLIRPLDAKTESGSGTTTVNCPNCGAALDINNSSKCPYCDSVVTIDKHDWVISSIKGISQRTA